MLDHPQLAPYFETGNTVFNERDILMADGSIERPDKVVLKDTGVTIIDYKTGVKDSRYKLQIEEYASAYLNMGYTIEHKIIVYINENIITEFI